MTTNIYEKLRKLYGDRAASELDRDIAYYIQHGYIFATPDYFVMGRRISSGWYIYAAVGVGAIEGFLRYVPYDLPYIGWERRGGSTRWYSTEKLKKKLMKGKYDCFTN